jgi:hypothetical protein
MSVAPAQVKARCAQNQCSPIVVTGAHRSGTTWVGKVMASAPRTFYLQETFNVEYPNPFTAIRMKWSYQRFSGDGESAERRVFQDVFALRFRCDPKDPSRVLSRRGLMRRCFHLLRWESTDPAKCTIIMKDPLALFSIPWLVRHFGVRPVIMIRHPAAFVSSLRVQGWFFDFGNFLSQPGLVEDMFPHERHRIEEMARRQHTDVVSESAFLWRLLYTVVAKYRREYPAWTFVRHEDISRNPAEEFRRLFVSLGLWYTPRADAYLNSTITREDRGYVRSSTPVSDVVRNSAENVFVWKQRLTEAEIARTREVVGDVASEFYADEEW